MSDNNNCKNSNSDFIFKNVTLEEFKRVYYDVENYPTHKDIASYFRIGKRTLFYYIKDLVTVGKLVRNRKHLRNHNVKDEIKQECEKKEKERSDPLTIKLLRENAILQQRLNVAETQIATTERLKELIFDVKDNFVAVDNVPDWLIGEDFEEIKDSKSTKGVPVLCLGDWHYDEVVQPSQIGNVNIYNREIAEARLKHTFKTSAELFLDYTVKPSYPGVVICILGDMLSGNIHEELRETNEYPILQSLLDLSNSLIKGLNLCIKVFKRVFVVCVVGNHGRIDKKPRAKNKIFDNFDWLLYQFITNYFRNDEQISFYVPDGPDALFSIYNTRFLVTHGDQFKGGTGISGFLTPLALGYHRKQKKQTAIDKPFDIMICGHFHSTIKIPSMFYVNGCGKGYDEWANNKNLPFETPRQLAFLVHRHLGIIQDMSIFCDPYGKKFESLDNSKEDVIKLF